MTRHIPEKLRQLVAERAEYRCEYCRMLQQDSFFPFQIDHIISRKHGGATLQSNLAWSCFACNNEKGSDIATVLLPSKSLVRLFNPREDIWEGHFELDDGVFYAKTIIAEATIKVLKMNNVERIIERRALS